MRAILKVTGINKASDIVKANVILPLSDFQ